MRQRLKRINLLRLIGDAPGKGGIFSFELQGAHAHDVSTILDRYGIAVRAGTHCAMPLLQRFGVTSTCRASLALYSGRTTSMRSPRASRKPGNSWMNDEPVESPAPAAPPEAERTEGKTGSCPTCRRRCRPTRWHGSRPI